MMGSSPVLHRACWGSVGPILLNLTIPAPAEGPEKCGPRRPTRSGYSCNNASGGYEALVTWAETHGRIEAFGIEGTGSYGAGLARAVHRAGHHVVEVNRGDRRTRRAAGKSDTIDAEVAARSLLAGQSTAIPKTADGAVEMIRQLKITRDTAMKARTTSLSVILCL